MLDAWNIELDVGVDVEGDSFYRPEEPAGLAHVRIASLVERPCISRGDNSGVGDGYRTLRVLVHGGAYLPQPLGSRFIDEAGHLEDSADLERNVDVQQAVVMSEPIAKLPYALDSDRELLALP
ncbi:hypothetical protein ACFYO7_08040 [Nocardia salmonicida]|uniref:hypothetical protein n=1 Tax=Nocardia salmonicida TaxID=53431 RepID=UPI0036B2302D